MPGLTIRELESIADLRRAIQLEKQVWDAIEARLRARGARSAA